LKTDLALSLCVGGAPASAASSGASGHCSRHPHQGNSCPLGGLYNGHEWTWQEGSQKVAPILSIIFSHEAGKALGFVEGSVCVPRTPYDGLLPIIQEEIIPAAVGDVISRERSPPLIGFTPLPRIVHKE